MPFHTTIRNESTITEKATLTIDDDWSASLYGDKNFPDDPKCSWLIESLDERFELVLYVKDKNALQVLIDQFLRDLQELYIE